MVISYGQQFVSTSKGKVGGGDDDDDKGAETHANSSQMQPASSKLSKVNPDATSIPLVESFFFSLHLNNAQLFRVNPQSTRALSLF